MPCSEVKLCEDGKQAGLAQLEERGSHNPEVVSSSLTTRIYFSNFLLCNLPEIWELLF